MPIELKRERARKASGVSETKTAGENQQASGFEYPLSICGSQYERIHPMHMTFLENSKRSLYDTKTTNRLHATYEADTMTGFFSQEYNDI